jgi:hypothetical protein
MPLELLLVERSIRERAECRCQASQRADQSHVTRHLVDQSTEAPFLNEREGALRV